MLVDKVWKILFKGRGMDVMYVNIGDVRKF